MMGAQSLIIFSVFAFLWLNFAADMATCGKTIRMIGLRCGRAYEGLGLNPIVSWTLIFFFYFLKIPAVNLALS